MRSCRATVVIVFVSALFPMMGFAASETPQKVENCYEEQFIASGGPFGSVSFRSGTQPFIIDSAHEFLDSDISKCPRTTIDASHHWFAGKRIGQWVCISDGEDSGWTLADEVRIGDEPITHYSDWLGEWERDVGGAEMTITKADGGKLAVVGTAEWMAGPDAVPHTGDLDAAGRARGISLVLGDPKCLDAAWDDDSCIDCVARLVAINGRILVHDNYHCGGMNVRFDGMCDRVKPKNRK